MNQEFVITIGDKQFVTWAGLIDEATRTGLKSIEVEIVQVPDEANGCMAICRAGVEFEDGRTFREIGDANPKNVKPMVAPHLLRMAATRAKARCLRDALGVGTCSVEELSDDEPSKAPASNGGGEQAPKASGSSGISPKQATMILGIVKSDLFGPDAKEAAQVFVDSNPTMKAASDYIRTLQAARDEKS